MNTIWCIDKLQSHVMQPPTLQLAICEIWNPTIHGQDTTSSPNIAGQFLVHSIIDLEEFEELGFDDIIQMLTEGYHAYLSVWDDGRIEMAHPFIRNYQTIVRGDDYIKLDIVAVDELQGLEHVAYIKTHWIRLVQRCWKRIFKERKLMLAKRGSPKALRIRETTGQWPKDMRIWPRFRLGLAN